MASIRIPRDVLHRSLGGETVLMNLESGETFSLDPWGHRVWTLIEQHGERELVEQALTEEFDAPPEEISRDVGAFLEELEASGLLELADRER